MKYVTCMGVLYQMSDAAYRKMLKEHAATGTADLPGKALGYVKNITDMSKEEAAELLEDEKRKARKTT